MIRQKLQEETRAQHQILDAGMGGLTDDPSYHRYLSGTYAFRAALEPALQAAPDCGWQIAPLLPALHMDMAALNLPLPSVPPCPALLAPAAIAGALYVIEGSALGGRVLAKRAAALGFDAAHGASHLALQTDEPGRWKRFLGWLEACDPPSDSAASAAAAAFELALAAFQIGAAPLSHPNSESESA